MSDEACGTMDDEMEYYFIKKKNGQDPSQLSKEIERKNGKIN